MMAAPYLSPGVLAAAIAAGSVTAGNKVLNLEAGGYVQIPHNASQNPGRNITIEFWMKPLNATAGRPISKRPGSSGCYAIGIGASGTAAEWFGCGAVCWMAAPGNEWNHYAYVCNGVTGLVSYYRNGVLQCEAGVGPCSIVADVHPLCFGITPGFAGTQFFGRLDNIRIWNRPLGSAEIAGNALRQFVSGEAASAIGLIGSWSFDAGAPIDALGVNNGSLQAGAVVVDDDGPLTARDCNSNGMLDDYEVQASPSKDVDSNGVPDECECTGHDLNLDGSVDGADLGVMLFHWGPATTSFPRADINSDGSVDGADLGLILANWGTCS